MKNVLFSRIGPGTIATLERDHDLQCAFDLAAEERETMLSGREGLTKRFWVLSGPGTSEVRGHARRR